MPAEVDLTYCTEGDAREVSHGDMAWTGYSSAATIGRHRSPDPQRRRGRDRMGWVGDIHRRAGGGAGHDPARSSDHRSAVARRHGLVWNGAGGRQDQYE